MNWLLWGGPIAICGLLSLREAQGSEPVATIDTYGLARVCRAEVLKAAGISVGSPVPDPMESRRIEERLKGLAGVDDARVAVVHVRRQSAAENSPPQPTVYIGIREVGRPVVQFRPAPTAELALPAEVTKAFDEYERAFVLAVRSGGSQGGVRGEVPPDQDAELLAAQQKLAPLARQHFERLVEVLQSSARADQRAIAATVLGQAHDKVRAAVALDAAARDPSSKVRNNAIRALGLLLAEADMAPDLVAAAPIETYLDLLESLTWTDRNKAMLVLLGLSRGRNEAVLARLRACSVETLAEMAAWQTEGHALMALILLGRIAGLTDAETVEAWRNGKIEQVVDRARKSQN